MMGEWIGISACYLIVAIGVTIWQARIELADEVEAALVGLLWPLVLPIILLAWIAKTVRQ